MPGLNTMANKFTEVLNEYLDERDRQNSDYYKDRFFGDRTKGQFLLHDLAEELDKMVQGVEETFWDQK